MWDWKRSQPAGTCQLEYDSYLRHPDTRDLERAVENLNHKETNMTLKTIAAEGKSRHLNGMLGGIISKKNYSITRLTKRNEFGSTICPMLILRIWRARREKAPAYCNTLRGACPCTRERTQPPSVFMRMIRDANAGIAIQAAT